MTLNNSFQGGDNYAYAGAETGTQVVGSQVQMGQLIQVQLALQKHNNLFNKKELYILWSGANDIFYAVLHRADIKQIAQEAGEHIAHALTLLQGAGARYFMVGNVPDLGLTPKAHGSGAETEHVLTAVSAYFNTVQETALNHLPFDVFQWDDFNFLHYVVRHGQDFGLKYTNDQVGSSTEYLFFDDLHPSTIGQQLIADYHWSALEASHFYHALQQNILEHVRQHTKAIHREILEQITLDQLTVAGIFYSGVLHMFPQGPHSSDSDVKDNTNVQGILGYAYPIASRLSMGLAYGYGQESPVLGDNQYRYRDQHHTISFFSTLDLSHFYVTALINWSHIQIDSINRTTQIGSQAFITTGETETNHYSLGLRSAYFFNLPASNWRIGPLVDLTYQNAHFNRYTESARDEELSFLCLDFSSSHQETLNIGWGVQTIFNQKINTQTTLFMTMGIQWNANILHHTMNDHPMHVVSKPKSHGLLPVIQAPQTQGGYQGHMELGLAIRHGWSIGLSYDLEKSMTWHSKNSSLSFNLGKSF